MHTRSGARLSVRLPPHALRAIDKAEARARAPLRQWACCRRVCHDATHAKARTQHKAPKLFSNGQVVDLDRVLRDVVRRVKQPVPLLYAYKPGERPYMLRVTGGTVKNAGSRRAIGLYGRVTWVEQKNKQVQTHSWSYAAPKHCITLGSFGGVDLCTAHMWKVWQSQAKRNRTILHHRPAHSPGLGESEDVDLQARNELFCEHVQRTCGRKKHIVACVLDGNHLNTTKALVARFSRKMSKIVVLECSLGSVVEKLWRLALGAVQYRHIVRVYNARVGQTKPAEVAALCEESVDCAYLDYFCNVTELVNNPIHLETMLVLNVRVLAVTVALRGLGADTTRSIFQNHVLSYVHMRCIETYHTTSRSMMTFYCVRS